MDFFHCPIKILSRNKGRSAVAASAYISATRMENTWDGTTHDYTRKRHVVYTEVMLSAQILPCGQQLREKLGERAQTD